MLVCRNLMNSPAWQKLTFPWNSFCMNLHCCDVMFFGVLEVVAHTVQAAALLCFKAPA